jgi:hypothetical protein
VHRSSRGLFQHLSDGTEEKERKPSNRAVSLRATFQPVTSQVGQPRQFSWSKLYHIIRLKIYFTFISINTVRVYRGFLRTHNPIITSNIERIQNMGFKKHFKIITFDEKYGSRRQRDSLAHYSSTGRISTTYNQRVQDTIGALCYHNPTHHYDIIVKKDIAKRFYLHVYRSVKLYQ